MATECIPNAMISDGTYSKEADHQMHLIFLF